MDGKRTVLLIDDSVTIHRVVDLSIDPEQFRMSKVFSSEEAMQKLNENEYDFILLDNKLENINLKDFINTLKAYQPQSHIVLLVGAFDKFSVDDLEKSGANDYLIKPFDSQALNAKLVKDGISFDGAKIYGNAFADSDLIDSPDIMHTDFVERMPHADINRETDDFIPTPQPLTAQDDFNVFEEKSSSDEDNINAAFEKLLDDLFMDAAFDATTDAQVLQTLLAQEGLAEDEKFKQAGKQGGKSAAPDSSRIFPSEKQGGLDNEQ